MPWYTNLLGEVKLSENKRTWIQVLRPGTWKHDEYGKLDFTEPLFERLIKNFDNNVRKIDLAIDAEHKPEEGACGWVKKLENRGKDGLWALVEWTSRGMKFVSDGIYKYISIEYDPKWKDEETGRTYKDVMFGAALTNRPFIKGMAPVNLSEYKKQIQNDDEILKLVKLSESIKATLNEGNLDMKKCAKCGKEYEGEKCPECGSSETVAMTEEGEIADVKETNGGGKGTENREEQTEGREEEEKSENAGKVVASSLKRGSVLSDGQGNYYFEEDAESTDEEKKDDEEKKEDDETTELGCGKKSKKKMSESKKKLADGEELAEEEKKDEEEKDEEEDTSTELSEGVMIATKKLSVREAETVKAIRMSEGSTKKILKENLVALRESRLLSEKEDIEKMLSKHFLSGKMTVSEKNFWHNILMNEAAQVDVAVFKFSEGKKHIHLSMQDIVDRMFNTRPVIVELKELARTGGKQVSEETAKLSEAKSIAGRIARRFNADELKKRELAEKK